VLVPVVDPFEGVTVYVVPGAEIKTSELISLLGVPLIAHVVVLKIIPAGSEGEMEQLVTV
jgi:hypothetical protein